MAPDADPMGLDRLITARLQAALSPVRLQVIDDSAAHAGHAGARDGGGHFQVHVASDRFAGLALMARHRLIYAAVADLMPGRIHALSIRAELP